MKQDMQLVTKPLIDLSENKQTNPDGPTVYMYPDTVKPYV